MKKHFIFTLVVVCLSALNASAQSATPTPTPTPKECQDRNTNRQALVVERAARSCEREQDRVEAFKVKKAEQVLRVDNQIADVKDGRSTVSRIGCGIFGFISKCDSSKRIEYLNNRKTRLIRTWDLRIANYGRKAERTCGVSKSRADAFSALKARCNIQ